MASKWHPRNKQTGALGTSQIRIIITYIGNLCKKQNLRVNLFPCIGLNSFSSTWFCTACVLLYLKLYFLLWSVVFGFSKELNVLVSLLYLPLVLWPNFMHHLFMEYIWDITDLLTVNLWDIFDNSHSFVKVMEFIELWKFTEEYWRWIFLRQTTSLLFVPLGFQPHCKLW